MKDQLGAAEVLSAAGGSVVAGFGYRRRQAGFTGGPQLQPTHL